MPTLSAKMVLGWAMEIETNGEAFYKSVAASVTDPDAKALFEDLAYQEQRHFRSFQRLLERAPELDSDDDVQSYRAYFETALKSALFGPDKGLALAQKAHDEMSALQAALAFEKDTLLFFYELRDMMSQAHRETLSAVIQEEKSHIRQISQVIEQGPWVK